MHRPTKALLDGDILLYSCGFSVEHLWYVVKVSGVERCRYPSKSVLIEHFCSLWEDDDWYEVETEREVEPESHAVQALNCKINAILEDLSVSQFQVFLSDDITFRHKLATIKPYKGNRNELHKPVHYQLLKDKLLSEGAIIKPELEADDLLGLYQTESTVICSIDKDLLMIPGWHYNFNTRKTFYVEPFEALRNFYRQLLTGDSTDNIQGVPGIGNKRADKILDGAETEEELFERCQNVYRDKGILDQMEETGHLLWIQQSNRKKWNQKF